MWSSGSISLFCMWLPSFPISIYWRDCLFPSVCSWLLHCKWIDHIYIWGFISGLLILPHWPKCLFLCQYHLVLITIDLLHSLKLEHFFSVFYSLDLQYVHFSKYRQCLWEMVHFQTATFNSAEFNGSQVWSTMAKEVPDYTWLRGNFPFCSCFGKRLGTGEGKPWFL